MNPKILSSNSFSCTGFQAVPAEHGVTATILPHFGPENGCLTRRTFPTSAFILLDMMQIGQTEGSISGRSITLGNCCWIVSQVVFTSAKMTWCAQNIRILSSTSLTQSQNPIVFIAHSLGG